MRPSGESPPVKRKTLADSPFELGVLGVLGVLAIRATVAEKREGLWAEERKRPVLKICSNLLIHSVQGNKSLTAAGAHSDSLPPRTIVMNTLIKGRRKTFDFPEVVTKCSNPYTIDYSGV